MPDSTQHIVGVRLRNLGKINYYHSGGMRLEAGEYVVVESSRGPELGRVVIAPGQVVVNELGDDLPPILRLANDDDIWRFDGLAREGEELLPKARALAAEIGFQGHVEKTEFTLDRRRLSISFTSEERVEYRQLVRAASERFNVRVEARQVGARDRARLAGGYGVCGRELCCASWLATFPSISIRMAKEQDLSLNPQKISGLCGRLLCCLSYEDEGYKEMRKTLPKVGQRCSTPTGEGKVVAVNTLLRQVTLVVEGQRIEVRDRDLGTVVRWDPSSKAAEPPPSLTFEEAFDQGLIDHIPEEEPAGDAEWEPIEPGPGRGRLPAPAPRRVVKPRPEVTPASQPEQAEQAGDSRGRRRRGGAAQKARQAEPAPAAKPARSRTFRRSSGQDARSSPESPPTEASEPASGDGSQKQRSRRRGRRGGRRRGGQGGARQQD